MATKAEIVATTGQRLAEALELRQMKASELGKAADISKSTISYYLRDKITPKQDKIFLMAQALRVSPSWLMGFNVSISGKQNGNIAKDFEAEREWLRTNIEPSEEQQKRLYQEVMNLCNHIQETLISSLDKKMLARFHSLTTENQMLVMTMMENLHMAQAAKQEAEAKISEEAKERIVEEAISDDFQDTKKRPRDDGTLFQQTV